MENDGQTYFGLMVFPCECVHAHADSHVIEEAERSERVQQVITLAVHKPDGLSSILELTTEGEN